MRDAVRIHPSLPKSLGVVICVAWAIAASACEEARVSSPNTSSENGVASPILQFAAEAEVGEQTNSQEYEYRGETVLLRTPRSFILKDVSLGGDANGYPALRFEIADDQKEEFHQWTSGLVGRQLAFLVDGTVVGIAVVNSALGGSGIVSFDAQHRTEEEVRQLADRIRAQIKGGTGR